MMPAVAARQPRLIVANEPRRPTAVVLVLPGGQERSGAPMRGFHPGVLRMRSITAALTRAVGDAAMVATLRYRYRGWNEPAAPALEDARWALQRLREAAADAPIALVGHSLGGRVALRAADSDAVSTVVALAPWLPPDEDWPSLRRRRVLVVHGDRDHITDPAASLEFLTRIAGDADTASYVRVAGVGHALLRKRQSVERLIAGFTAASLGVSSAADDAADPVLWAALRGDPALRL